MRNAKLLVLAGVSVLCSVGCSIQLENTKGAAYDFSDYAYYDKAFGTSPSYRDAAAPEAHDRPVTVAQASGVFAPAKAELPARQAAPQYDASTSVMGAGVGRSSAERPAKATAFASHEASVFAGEAQ